MEAYSSLQNSHIQNYMKMEELESWSGSVNATHSSKSNGPVLMCNNERLTCETPHGSMIAEYGDSGGLTLTGYNGLGIKFLLW